MEKNSGVPLNCNTIWHPSHVVIRALKRIIRSSVKEDGELDCFDDRWPMKDIKEVQRFLIHLLHHIEGPYPRKSQQDIRDPYLLIIEQKYLRTVLIYGWTLRWRFSYWYKMAWNWYVAHTHIWKRKYTSSIFWHLLNCRPLPEVDKNLLPDHFYLAKVFVSGRKKSWLNPEICLGFCCLHFYEWK